MAGSLRFDILEQWYKGILDFVFRPLYPLLTKIGATPNKISHFRLFLGLLGLYLIDQQYLISGSTIFLIALLLDSVDGGLARHQKRVSHRGMFIDRVCDYTLYTASVLTMLCLGEIGGFGGSYHVFIVFAAVILAIIARNEGKKSDWIIKPRAGLVWFMIAWYLSIAWWVLFDGHTIEKVLFWLNVLLTVTAIESYWVIYARWFFSTPPHRNINK